LLSVSCPAGVDDSVSHGESRFQQLIQLLQMLALAARGGGGRNFPTDIPESITRQKS